MTGFERFFHEDFPRRLSAVKAPEALLSSGLPLDGASWDRKAAFLVWEALGRPEAAPPEACDLTDMFG